jgi:hypothetical protein
MHDTENKYVNLRVQAGGAGMNQGCDSQELAPESKQLSCESQVSRAAGRAGMNRGETWRETLARVMLA